MPQGTYQTLASSPLNPPTNISRWKERSSPSTVGILALQKGGSRFAKIAFRGVIVSTPTSRAVVAWTSVLIWKRPKSAGLRPAHAQALAATRVPGVVERYRTLFTSSMGCVGDEREDLHLGPAAKTGQRVDLVHLADEPGPARRTASLPAVCPQMPPVPAQFPHSGQFKPARRGLGFHDFPQRRTSLRLSCNHRCGPNDSVQGFGALDP